MRAAWTNAWPVAVATLAWVVCAGALAGGPAPTSPDPPRHFGEIDGPRLAAAASEPGEWFTPGGDAAGGYYSRLTQINVQNVAKLGFAWQLPLHTSRGLEATPVVVDGVMYTSGNWGRVYALDATTGRELWVYDPEVDAQWGRNACCDVVNRGVAVWRGKVYVASTDGYLHAVDAATGRRVLAQRHAGRARPRGFPLFPVGRASHRRR